MSGAEGMYLAAALAAGGTAANYAGQKQQQHERRAILNNAFADQEKTLDKATKLVSDEGSKFQSDQRRADMAAQEASAFAQSQKDLQGAGAGGDMRGTVGDSGNVSSDFLKSKADKTLSEGNRMTSLAREVAKTRAPGLLMGEEKMRGADLIGRTGSMWSGQKARTNAAGLDAQSVQEPWWGTMGKLAQQAGLMYLMGSGAGAGMSGAAGASGGAWGAGADAAGYGTALA